MALLTCVNRTSRREFRSFAAQSDNQLSATQVGALLGCLGADDSPRQP